MHLKIWFDRESEKFCKIFWELNKALLIYLRQGLIFIVRWAGLFSHYFLLDDGTSVLRGVDGCTCLGLHFSSITFGGVEVCSTFCFGFHTSFGCEGLGTSSLFSFFLGVIFFFCSLLFFLRAAFSFGSGFSLDIFLFLISWGWISTYLMPWGFSP